MAKARTEDKGSPEKTLHAEVASIKDMSQDDVDKLLSQIKDLREQLATSETARSEAEKAALAAAEAQGALMQREIQEVATGKKIKVKRAEEYKVVGYRDDGREIYKPVWKDVYLPTYFYKIDIPPVGGVGLTMNGVPLYHGQVVELDVDTLRTVKEMVYRLWDHDRNIHGSDENFYRSPRNDTLSMSRRAA